MIRPFLFFILVISGMIANPCFSSPTDSLHLQLISKQKRKLVARLEVKVEKIDTVYMVDSKGYVCIVGLKPATYTLTVKHKGFRKALQKIEAKHFNSKDTVKITMQPSWKIKGNESLAFAQNAYGPYWQAGGINSFAIRAATALTAEFKRGNNEWETTFDLSYGVIKQGENDFATNEDQIDITSKYGLAISKRFLITSLLNIRTQFYQTHKVNKNGEQGELTGRSLTPFYLNFGSGMDLKMQKVGLSLYYSPINSKVTWVRDTSLSRLYLPKNLRGKNGRYEFGSFLRVKYKKEILKNVTLETKANFFANHLDFGSIDVNWETLMAFRVNKYITANVLTQLIYDEDIQFVIRDKEGNPLTDPVTGQPTGQKGPRTQFREALNIGLVHKF